MARIAGVDIPKTKKIGTALTYIYGIGPTSAMKILEEARVSPDLRTATLGESGIGAVEWLVNREDYEVGGGSSTVNAMSWDASVTRSTRHEPDLGDDVNDDVR